MCLFVCVFVCLFVFVFVCFVCFLFVCFLFRDELFLFVVVFWRVGVVFLFDYVIVCFLFCCCTFLFLLLSVNIYLRTSCTL